MSRLILIAVAIALLAAPVLAQEPELVGDRPDFTESALAVPDGSVQLELGVTQLSYGDDDALEIGELLVRYGIASGTELRLGVPSYVDVSGPNDFSVSGLTNPSLGLKHEFLPCDCNSTRLAVLAAVSLPFGDEDVAPDAVEPEIIVAAEWDLAENIGLGTNVGWSSLDDGTDRYSSFWLSAAVGFGLTDRLGAFVEAYGFNQEASDGDATLYGDLGLTYLINPTLQVDLRAGTGFGDVSEAKTIGAGLVTRF